MVEKERGEGLKPNLSPELEQAFAVAARITAVVKPLVETATDQRVIETTGWASSGWRGGNGGTWEWTSLHCGGLAVGQEKALRGPNGEGLSLSIRYKPGDRDGNPSWFNLRAQDREGNRVHLDVQDDNYGVRVDAWHTTEDSRFFCHVKGEEASVTVEHLPLRFAVYFENAPVKNGLIELNAAKIKVGDHVATPNKEALNSTADVAEWWIKQRFMHGELYQVLEWAEKLPQFLVWSDILKEIEDKTGQVINTLSSVAENPDSGQVYTRKQEDVDFKANQERRERMSTKLPLGY